MVPRASAAARRASPRTHYSASAVSPRSAIAANEFADAVTHALATLFPQDPPRFMARTPHGYHDAARIARDLAAAGFTSEPKIETVAFTSRAVSPYVAALAYCQGTHCAARLKRVTQAGWSAPLRSRKRSWRAASVLDRSKVASKRSW
jgi:hypothetical protein